MCKLYIYYILSIGIFLCSRAAPDEYEQLPKPANDEIIVVNGPLYDEQGKISTRIKRNRGKSPSQSRIQVYIYDGNRPPLTTVPRSAVLEFGEWQVFRAAAGPFDKKQYKMPLVISVGTGIRKLNVFGPVHWGDIVGVRMLEKQKDFPDAVGGYEWECVGSPACVAASRRPAT